MSYAFEAEFFRRVLAESGMRPRNLLVVGCGEGIEVASMGSALGAGVVGVDLVVDGAWQGRGGHLVKADARQLPFRDGAFDAVYCYHVLEHVPGPQMAVAECRRTLTAGGLGFFGTPNRERLVGYVGGRGTALDKLRWNIHDWGVRLRGRWSNEMGAHAGFSQRELGSMLAREFPDVTSLNQPYYEAKYSKLAALWRLMFRIGLAGVLAPSVYFRTRLPAGGAGR